MISFTMGLLGIIVNLLIGFSGGLVVTVIVWWKYKKKLEQIIETAKLCGVTFE